MKHFMIETKLFYVKDKIIYFLFVNFTLFK